MKRGMGLEMLLAGTAMKVCSLADGGMVVEVSYKCGLPGFLGRTAIADELTKLCNSRIKRAKRAIVKKKA